MVGILIVAHGNLAESLIETAELIVGKVKGIKACSFTQGSDVEKLKKMLKTSIKDVNEGDGVIILTDMFGGTPSNISLAFLEEKVEVITGVNLPMAIGAITKREGRQIGELAQLLRDSGKSNIYIASEILASAIKK
jgi:PTS system mannose-specific IIA component